MGKKGYHHGDLREALLDAAEELASDQRTQGWSLRVASARVGVSPSAAYHHFSSREALVGALAVRLLGRLGEEMRSAAETAARGAREGGGDPDPLAGLVSAGCAYVDWVVRNPALTRLVTGARAHGSGGPTGDTPAPVPHPHPHEVLDGELDRLVETGWLTQHARFGADFAVWATLHGLATLLADGLMTLDSPRDTALHVQRVLRAVLTGLAQEHAGDPGLPRASSTYTAHRAAGDR